VTLDLRPVDFPIQYRTLVLNPHRTAVGGYDKTYETHTIRVDTFDYSRVQLRDQREALSLVTGGLLGDATESFRYISLTGSIIAPTGSELEDDIARFLQTFDLEESIIASEATKGITALTFTCPTDIVNYSPYQAEKFMVRPAGYPVIRERRSGGSAVPFALELIAEDPRRYRDAQTIKVLISGALASQHGYAIGVQCPNWNSSVGRQVSPLVTIVMAGSGASNFTLSDGVTSFVLNLSGSSNNDVITVDMATAIIRRNGAMAASLRTSTVDTFLAIPRGGVYIGANNTTNVTSCTISYYEARA